MSNKIADAFTLSVADLRREVHGKFVKRRVDVVMLGPDGSEKFRQDAVEAPYGWSDTAIKIVASKYFAGQIGTPERESSVFQLVHRVVARITEWGCSSGYFDSVGDACSFYTQLSVMCLEQRFFFNSPVWFNLGVEGRPQQASACFINSVEDSMESILDLHKTEGTLFKGGSGTGTNMSKLRGKNEPLSTGGYSSGMMSFIKALDAGAGAIKSGGTTRRAAKMIVCDADHPDVEEFITSKALEEKKAQALMAAGYSPGLNGEAYETVAFQNANHSVRVSDEFMRKASGPREDASWPLKNVTDGRVNKEHNAVDLLDAMAQACWECGDPGLQFDGEIQLQHTTPGAGRIEATNPCSEYMFLDDTACNLASFNIMKYMVFLKGVPHSMAAAVLSDDIGCAILAMDIIVGNADYPTELIRENSRKYRTLGLGYTNLGAVLMLAGVPYDSAGGRSFAAAVTYFMNARAYLASVRIAERLGVGEGIEPNIRRVMARHSYSRNFLCDGDGGALDSVAANLQLRGVGCWDGCWDDETAQFKLPRNAQLTVIAPTGTISFAMDCITTAGEPELAMVKFKTLVGGGVISQANPLVRDALELNTDMDEEDIRKVVDYVETHGTAQGCPQLTEDWQNVFLCSFKSRSNPDDRCLSVNAHIDMMAAQQPHISGAISKTINMPKDASVDDIREAFVYAWRSRLKAVAIYRDECKGAQPVRTGGVYDESKQEDPEPNDDAQGAQEASGSSAVPAGAVIAARRERLPDTRPSQTHKFTIGGFEGYIVTGFYNDGRLGEVFINAAKEGSTVSGLLDSIALLLSIGLQHGVPLESLVHKLKGAQFEPAGFTPNPDIRLAKSIVDYVARYLMQVHKSKQLDLFRQFVQDCPPLGPSMLAVGDDMPEETAELNPKDYGDNVPCNNCGGIAVRRGSCYCCENCGETTGCG